LGDGSADVDEVVMQLVHDAKAECSNPTEVVSLIRSIKRESNRREASQVSADELAVANFSEQATPLAVAGLTAHSEELRPWASMLNAQPLGPNVTLVHTDPHAAADNAVQLVAAAELGIKTHKRGLTVVANEFVDHAVRLIRGVEAQSASEVPPYADECDGRCFVHGYCSCSIRGRKVRNIGNSLLSTLKLFSHFGRKPGDSGVPRASVQYGCLAVATG
jgi:hypothetical protein